MKIMDHPSVASSVAPSKVYAIVPAYNEEKNIEAVVSKLINIGIAPLVIDDASTDRTEAVAKRMGVEVVRHAVNKGKGEAIKTGIEFLLNEHPDVEHVVLIDADGQYLPEESVKILEPLRAGRADIVAGYRDWSKVPYRHRMGNFVWRTFFNVLFGTKFKDTNCGFMALNKKAMKIIKDFLHGGYIIENTIFTQALKHGLRIEQVSVSVVYKKKSSVSRGIRVVLGVLIFIIKQGFKHRLGVSE